MSVGTVVFLRHGRTAYNAQGRLQGQVDIPLDDVGEWQAEHGATALARSHRPTLVVSSDLVRARVTAEAYADAVGIRIVIDPRARERGFGEWEGLSGSELEERWPEEYAQWRRGEEPPRAGAESRAAVAARMLEAITEHGGALEKQDTLVVVSHGAAITIALTAMLGLDASTWRGLTGLNNVHWSQVNRSGPSAHPGWRLMAHNIGAGYPLDHWNAGPDWNFEASSS